MREIKFQAWDLDAEQMYNWESIKQLFHEHLAHPRVKVRQYTGLKDRNGREIYEGDIVCDQYANFYTPIFRNGIYMAYNVEYLNLTKQEPSTQFNVVWNNGCEIIGNIYENPELLEASHASK